MQSVIHYHLISDNMTALSYCVIYPLHSNESVMPHLLTEVTHCEPPHTRAVVTPVWSRWGMLGKPYVTGSSLRPQRHTHAGLIIKAFWWFTRETQQAVGYNFQKKERKKARRPQHIHPVSLFFCFIYLFARCNKEIQALQSCLQVFIHYISLFYFKQLTDIQKKTPITFSDNKKCLFLSSVKVTRSDFTRYHNLQSSPINMRHFSSSASHIFISFNQYIYNLQPIQIRWRLLVKSYLKKWQIWVCHTPITGLVCQQKY